MCTWEAEQIEKELLSHNSLLFTAKGLERQFKRLFLSFLSFNHWVGAQISQSIANVSILGLFSSFRLPIQGGVLFFDFSVLVERAMR